MAEAKILVVEDDRAQRSLIGGILRNCRYQVLEATSAEEASELLQQQACDLVLCDYKLPGRDGLALLSELRSQGYDAAFIMVTAYGTIARAVEAVRAGADDYLAKPFERGELELALSRTLRARALRTENKRLAAALTERDRLVDLLGRAPSMQKAFRRMEKLAGTDAPILIQGERGSGKELAARALHELSLRREGPFVAIACAGTPAQMLEQELFGQDRGRMPRLLESAHGTLFLDEVGELPVELQGRLMRVIEEKRFPLLGSTREFLVDLRIIASTRSELELEVRAGRFRDDLYRRLALVPIHLPPLRERREDLPFLIDHFAESAAKRHGMKRPQFPSELTRRLLDHAWPGNVRELAETIERLVLLAEEQKAALADLPEAFHPAQAGSGAWTLPPQGISWEEHEGQAILQAMQYARGNRTRAAKLLGLPYKAFLYRLEKHEERQGMQHPAEDSHDHA